MFQGKSEVLGDEVRLDDVSQNLEATGHVSTTFEMTVQAGGASTPAKPADYHVTATTFRYEDAKRIATYEGKDPPVIMKGTDGETEGQKIVLRLAKDSRTLEQMHVEGGDKDFYTKMSGGYETTGAILDYDVATDEYVLTGKPVQGQVAAPGRREGPGPMRSDPRPQDRPQPQGRLGPRPGSRRRARRHRHDELRSVTADDPLMATLRTEGLTKAFGGRTVVRNVDLDVSSGEIVGLLGPNGAGKTTTFSMVVGLIGPDGGKVRPRRTRRDRGPDVHPGAQGHRLPAAGALRVSWPHRRAERSGDPRDACRRTGSRSRRGSRNCWQN